MLENNFNNPQKDNPNNLEPSLESSDDKTLALADRIRHGIETVFALLDRIKDFQRRHGKYSKYSIDSTSISYGQAYTKFLLCAGGWFSRPIRVMSLGFVPVDFKEKVMKGDEQQKEANLKAIYAFQCTAVLYTCAFNLYPFNGMDSAMVAKNIGENKPPDFDLKDIKDESLKLKIEAFCRHFYTGSDEHWQRQFELHFPSSFAKTDPLEKFEEALIELQKSLPQPLTSNLQVTKQQPSMATSDRVSENLNLTLSQHYQIDPSTINIEQDQLLGRGGFGVVYKGYDQIRKQEVAVKVLKPSNGPQLSIKQILRECQLMVNLPHHRNITSFYGMMDRREDSDKDSINAPAFVLEYMPDGNLHSLLNSQADIRLNFYQKWKICLGVSRGLEYLHGYKIIHGDIMPPNVLLKKEYSQKTDCTVYRPKLTDFDFSIHMDSPPSSLCYEDFGKLLYLPPEALRIMSISLGSKQAEKDDDLRLDYFKMDCYALALLFLETLTRRQPHKFRFHFGIYDFVCSGKLPRMYDLARDDIDAKNFIVKGLNLDPKQRPNATEFLKFAKNKCKFFKSQRMEKQGVKSDCRATMTPTDPQTDLPKESSDVNNNNNNNNNKIRQ